MNQQIPSLNEVVLKTLDFFSKSSPPTLDVDQFNLPFVIGSGNAYNTGLIIFSGKAAIFADESNFKKLIPAFEKAIQNKLITQAVIISASGGKDSVWELELAKKHGLQTTLLTTKANSEAAQIADKVYTYKSLSEPYTYNTSTYMGMVFSATKENPKTVKEFINQLKFPENFGNYWSYAFVLPDEFGSVCPMIEIKKHELFGPFTNLRAFPQGHARHAKFVIRTDKELVITIGSENEFFGHPNHRWNIIQPNTFSFAGIMALTYYIVGKIQVNKPDDFKKNIVNYVSDYGPKAYGKNDPFDLIVPGSEEQ